MKIIIYYKKIISWRYNEFILVIAVTYVNINEYIYIND